MLTLEKLRRDRPAGVRVLPHVPCSYLHDQYIAKGLALHGKQELGDNPQGPS